LITDLSDPGPAGTLNTIYIFLCFFSYYFLFHLLEGAERSTVQLDSKLEVLGSNPRKDKLKKLHRTHWILVYYSSKLKYISKDDIISSSVGWVRAYFFQASIRSKSGSSLEYHIELVFPISCQILLNIAKTGQFGCQICSPLIYGRTVQNLDFPFNLIFLFCSGTWIEV